MVPLIPIYRSYLAHLSLALESDRSLQIDPRFGIGTLGLVGTAAQAAVVERYRLAAGSTPGPLASLDDLQRAATSATALVGVKAEISTQQLVTVLQQPAVTGGRLAALGAAATRVLGEAISAWGMVGIDAIYPVMRTIDMGSLRHAQAAHEGYAAFSNVVSFIGAAATNEGIGMVLLTRHGLVARRRDSQPIGDADDVRMRVIRLAALTRELRWATSANALVILRGERRFAPGDEGTATAPRLWFASEQRNWLRDVAEHLGDAVFVAEIPHDWLVDCSYSLRGVHRRLGSVRGFLADIERRDAAVHAWDLLMTSESAERHLAGADDVVVLDGTLTTSDGNEFVLVVVPSPAESTLYVIPRGRALEFKADDWDVIRRGLASLHGRAAARSSADQGVAISAPFQRSLSLSSPDLDVASNLDLLRTFSQNVTNPAHWLGGHPPHADESSELRAI